MYRKVMKFCKNDLTTCGKLSFRAKIMPHRINTGKIETASRTRRFLRRTVSENKKLLEHSKCSKIFEYLLKKKYLKK